MPCQLCDGGDAAGANAMAALESPPSRQGCCHYCELPGTAWYDRGKCDSATRRTVRRAYLSAHLVPPGTPPGTTLLCPKCGYGVNAEQEARDLKEHEGLSATKANAVDVEHRRHHAGQQYLQRKLLLVDHKWRALSLLHLMLNTVGSTLTVCVAAGATKKNRADCNALLEEEHHQWRLKETKSTFEKKPAGNECRHFLWKPGDVLLKLLRARYGVAAGSCAPLEAEVRAAQSNGAHHINTAPTRVNATPRDPPPPPPPKKQKKRAAVSVAGAMGLATAAVAATSVLKPNLPPPPPPAPAPATLPTTAATVAANTAEIEEDPIELEERDLDGLNEAMPDTIVGDYQSALVVVLALLKLMLYLHDSWDDSTLEKRRVRGQKAQELGAAFTVAIRAHAGNAMRHYYNHVVFAHLAELIELHGNLQSGNDEILEKGNGDVKHDKRLAFRGGVSGEGASLLQRARRWKPKSVATGEQEEYIVQRKQLRGVMESVLRNQKTREIQQAARKHPSLRQTNKVAAHNKAVRERRECVKKETEKTVEYAVAPTLARVPEKQIFGLICVLIQ